MAFDKSQPKIDKVKENAAIWGLHNISPYVFDATKSVDEKAGKNFH